MVWAGLLTPLNITWHHLSPLVFLLPVQTFFTMEGSDSEFKKFTAQTLKAFLKECSKSVSGNKQELVAFTIGCHENAFFPLTRILLVSRKMMQRHFFNPPTLFHCNSHKCNSSGICTALEF